MTEGNGSKVACYSQSCADKFSAHQKQGDMVIWGTHGTSEYRARLIFKDGFTNSELEDCSKKLQWLGTGVYFFENDKKAAEGWAVYRSGRDKSNPIVLIATLACSEDRFFDLNSPVQLELYRKYYNKVGLDAKQYVSRGDKIDGFILEVLCKELNVAMLRASLNTLDEFPIEPIEEYSRFVSGVQVQICVRDDACIKALDSGSREIQVNELIC